jgi:hypothetical protein
LKFFNIRVRVSGEGTEVFFNLRQVCERKGNMNLHDTLGASHLPEREGETSWLGVGCESKCVGGSGDPVVLDLDWWKGRWKGEQKEEERKGWKERWGK